MTDHAFRRYSTVALCFHWAIAALIIANIILGLRFDGMHGMAKFAALQWHKSIGVTVLILSFARLAWRLGHAPPPFPAAMAGWEVTAGRAVHWGFYALMIALPLSGWMMVSASPTNIPTMLYKVVPWPHIGPIHDLPLSTRKGLDETLSRVHQYLAWSTILLLALHVAAVLKHLLVSRDEVLWRMAPLQAFWPRSKES